MCSTVSYVLTSANIMDRLLKSIENVKQQVANQNVEDGVNLNCKLKYPLLLNATSYPLNKSRTKFISVGLCSYGSFAPAVVIYGQKGDWMFLDQTEWKALVENQGVICNYFSSGGFYPQLCVNLSSMKTIAFVTVAKKKVIVLQQRGGPEVYLGSESLSECWELLPLLEYKMELLQSHEFGKFYSSLINGVWSMPGNIKDNIENVLYGLDLKSDNVVCIREMLKYALDVIECDIEVNQFTQTMNQ